MGKPAAGTKRAHLTGEFGVLLVVTILMRASQNMAMTTFPLVAVDLLHMDTAAVGVIAAVAGGVAVLTMLTVVSRVPPGKALHAVLLAIAVMTLAFPLLAEANGSVTLVLGAMALGVGGGLALPTLITAVGELAGEYPGARDRPLALFSVALSGSLAIGPFAETAVLHAVHGSVRHAFLWFMTAPMVAVIILLGVIAQGRNRRVTSATPGPGHVRVADRDPEAVSGAAERARSSVPIARRRSRRHAIGTVWGDATFRVALFGQLIYAVPFSAVVVFGALLARHDYGASASATQISFGVFFDVSFAVRTLLVWRSPIRRKLTLFGVSALLTPVGIVLLATGSSTLALLIAMGLLGVPHGLTFPLSRGLIAENRSLGQLSVFNANLSASVQVVNLVLPFIFGVGIHALGYRPMFLLLVPPIIAAGLLQQWTARRLPVAGMHSAVL